MPDDNAHGEGFISRETLNQLLPEDRDVDLYFLGPKPFMKSVRKLATELGVPREQVRDEFFGPLEELEAS